MSQLSLSIEAEKTYYAALKTASRSNEVTKWLHYFVDLVGKAQLEVEKQVNFILKKTQFFDQFANVLNERQLKVTKRMLQAGVAGFEGGMSAKKYMTITATSKATATRDLHQLFAIGAFKQMGSGRSVRYELDL